MGVRVCRRPAPHARGRRPRAFHSDPPAARSPNADHPAFDPRRGRGAPRRGGAAARSLHSRPAGHRRHFRSHRIPGRPPASARGRQVELRHSSAVRPRQCRRIHELRADGRTRVAHAGDCHGPRDRQAAGHDLRFGARRAARPGDKARRLLLAPSSPARARWPASASPCRCSSPASRSRTQPTSPPPKSPCSEPPSSRR